MVVPTLRLWRLGCGLGTFHTQNPRVISYKTVTSELFVGKKRGEREREREFFSRKCEVLKAGTYLWAMVYFSLIQFVMTWWYILLSVNHYFYMKSFFFTIHTIAYIKIVTKIVFNYKLFSLNLLCTYFLLIV